MDGFALVHWWVPRERQELVANALRTLADNPATPVGNLAGAPSTSRSSSANWPDAIDQGTED